jgi:hypothetical protein
MNRYCSFDCLKGRDFHNRRSATCGKRHTHQPLPERQYLHNRRSMTCGYEDIAFHITTL